MILYDQYQRWRQKLKHIYRNYGTYMYFWNVHTDGRHEYVILHSKNSLNWNMGGSVAEWLACWTQTQKGLGSNRSCDAVG